MALAAWRSAERSASSTGGVDASAMLRALALVCWVLAGYVAASRVRDNYHHPADVITGLCLGTATAYMVALTTWPRAQEARGAASLLW